MPFFFDDKKLDKIGENLFYALWTSALCGIGLSYKSVYLFHIIWCINVLFFSFRGVFSPAFRNEIRQKSDFLSLFWLATLFWFAFEMLYCADKTAAFRHLIILFLGVSLLFFPVIILKTKVQFTQTARLTAFVFAINMLIGLVESIGLWRYPISNASLLNPLWGYTNTFWESVQMAFIGSLHSPSSSANYLATLHGAYDRVGSIPTAMYWNPNDFALFLLLILPFFWFRNQKIIYLLATIAVFWLFVATGARLVVIASLFSYIIHLFLFITTKKIEKTDFKPVLLPFICLLFIISNGFGLAGQYFWQFNEISFLNKIEKMETMQPTHAENSINIRKTLTQEALNTFVKNDAIGIGGGNMESILIKKGGVGANKITKLHNFWLEMTVEGGIIWLLFFAFWYLRLLSAFYKKIRHSAIENPLYSYFLPTFVALIALPIGGIAPSSLLYYLPMYAFFGWAVALLRAE